MTEKDKIILEAKRRGIEYVVHFTNINNLKNIFQYGLCPRDTLDYYGISHQINDEYRLDNLTNSSSLSITSPNYKMFYRVRKENPDEKWVVIIFKAFKIFELDCAFCKSNAASSSVTSIPINERKSAKAFSDMFYEPEIDSRKVRNLSDCEPTDPQAEILVFDSIPINYIECVHFQSFDDYLWKKKLLDDYGIYGGPSSSFFSARRDYSYWC